MERKLRYGKFGLIENPLGLFVSMPWNGRTLLGEVKESQWDTYRGAVLLTINHFCGDPWPLKVVASAVTVLE